MKIKIRKRVWFFVVISIFAVLIMKFYSFSIRKYINPHKYQLYDMIKNCMVENTQTSSWSVKFPHVYSFLLKDGSLVSINIKFVASSKMTLELMAQNFEIVYEVLKKYFSSVTIGKVREEIQLNGNRNIQNRILTIINYRFKDLFIKHSAHSENGCSIYSFEFEVNGIVDSSKVNKSQ